MSLGTHITGDTYARTERRAPRRDRIRQKWFLGPHHRLNSKSELVEGLKDDLKDAGGEYKLDGAVTQQKEGGQALADMKGAYWWPGKALRREDTCEGVSGESCLGSLTAGFWR